MANNNNVQNNEWLGFLLPEHRKPLLFLALAIVLSFIYRLLGGPGLGNMSDSMSIGRLPGDFYYQSETTLIYFPMMSGLLVSFLLTVVLNFLNHQARN